MKIRKCPYCGSDYYMEKYSVTAAVYIPRIYKNGKLVSSGEAPSTVVCECMRCHKEFSYDPAEDSKYEDIRPL